MILSLFGDTTRIDLGPKRPDEGDLEYLERSGRPEAELIRGLIDEILAAIPAEPRRELMSRLKSGDPVATESAVFEMLLWRTLKGLGAEVQFHPPLETESTKRPDFLVEWEGGDAVFLEAIVSSEDSIHDAGANRRKEVVLSAIDELDSPNFSLGILAAGDPSTPPRGKALCRDIEKWLESLDPDAVIEEVRDLGPDAYPTLLWEHEGWEVEFTAHPRSRDRRGEGQRTIGVLGDGEARQSFTADHLRRALRKKAGRYGMLPHPLVVAVNYTGLVLERIDEMEALFGTEQFTLRQDAEPVMTRAPNGVWYGPHGARNTRLTGAWIFAGLSPWTIASATSCLYFNPYSTTTLPEALKRVTKAEADECRFRWEDGAPLWHVMGLWPNWPKPRRYDAQQARGTDT
jgi:hypothetical protein